MYNDIFLSIQIWVIFGNLSIWLVIFNLFCYFLNSKLCLISLLQFFFIKYSKRVFTIKVFYYYCLWCSVFSFLITKIVLSSLDCNLIIVLYFDILTWSRTTNLGPPSLLSTSKWKCVLDLASIGLILLLQWYVCIYQLYCLISIFIL